MEKRPATITIRTIVLTTVAKALARDIPFFSFLIQALNLGAIHATHLL